MTPMAEFFGLSQGCTPGLKQRSFCHLEPRGPSVCDRQYELQDRAGQLRAHVAVFERPERLLRGAAQPQVPGMRQSSERP